MARGSEPRSADATAERDGALARLGEVAGNSKVSLCLADGRGVTVLGPDSAGSRLADRSVSIGCLIKPITAALILESAEAGLLALDDSIAGYFPRLSSKHPAAEITVRNLMLQTSGFDGWELEHALLAQSSEPGRFSLAPPAVPDSMTTRFSAGRFFSYGNTDYILLAAILERALEQPFPAIMIERVLSPLGLKPRWDRSSRPEWSVDLLQGAYSTLAITSSEILELFRAHVAPAETGALPSRRVAAAMRGSGVAMPEGGAGCEAWTLGWSVFRKGVLGHNTHSGGIITCLRLIPEFGALLVARAEHGTVLAFVDHAIDTLFGMPPRREIAPSYEGELDIRACRGDYENHFWKLRLDECEGCLSGSGQFLPFHSPQPFRLQLSPVSRNRFGLRIDGRVSGLVHFIFEPAGDKPAYLWNGQHLAVRVDEE